MEAELEWEEAACSHFIPIGTFYTFHWILCNGSISVFPSYIMMFKFQVDHVLLSDLTWQSLRDPNSTQTLSAFRGGVEWARGGKFTQQDIDEAKLSVFSAVDAPVAPSDKGQ